MPIIPSGGAYPGIINEATLLADAAASVAAAKATAVPDAAAVAAAKAAAVPDAAAVAAAKAAAVPDAAAVSAAKATAVPDAATIAALVSPAQADASAADAARIAAQADAATVAALVSPAQGNAATVAALVSPAQANAAATAAAKDAANAAYDAIVGVPLRIDAAQSLTEAQRTQGRENLGVGTSGGCAYVAGTHTPATAYPAFNDFEAHAEVVHGITGTLFSVVHGGGTYAVAANDARFGSARWRGVSYGASAGMLTLLADGIAHATTTALTAGTVTVSPLSGVTGTVLRAARIANRVLTSDERAAMIRGETPVGLAGPGVKLSGNLTNGSGGLAAFESVTDASIAGFALTATSAGVHGAGSPISVPVGGSVRVSGTSQSWSGVVSVALLNGATVVSQHVIAQNGPWSAVLNATTAVTQIAVLVDGVGSIWSSGNSVEVLGTVARYEPQNVTPQGRWLDSSGNAYDLIPGAGITPLNPSPSLSRVIAATVSGATVAAGTVASVGALTGATPSDIAAIAAVRQWDAVSASWGQARPANASALVPTATANGTVALETSAHTSAATVSAGTAVKLIHHIA